MRSDYLLWGGLILAGVVAGISLPKILPRARMAARAIGGMTYTSNAPERNATPKADPARGIPA